MNNERLVTKAARTSAFCTSAKAVIQVVPGLTAGQLRYAHRRCWRIASWMILPGDRGTIACPLNYFQHRASLRGRWLDRLNGQRLELRGVGALEAVTISVIAHGVEREVALPGGQAAAILEYFLMDIRRDEAGYHGFDCYAFVSLVTNTLYDPSSPPFDYEARPATPGDVVVFARGSDLPHGIRHWALCVGENLFLSKFGQAGHGAHALLETTDAEAIVTLYECDRFLVARRKAHAPPWNRGPWPARRTAV